MKKLVVAIAIALMSTSMAPAHSAKSTLEKCSFINRSLADKTPPLPCLDGSIGVAISAIRGPAIINVWGSWCGPCRQEMPYFVAFNKKYGNQVQLIGVDVSESSPADGQKFVKEHGMAWPNLFDVGGSTKSTFGMGVPITWFVDAKGKVLYKKIGVLSSQKELISLSKKYLGIK